MKSAEEIKIQETLMGLIIGNATAGNATPNPSEQKFVFTYDDITRVSSIITHLLYKPLPVDGYRGAIKFGQWLTLNDWTYLKSKGYWVNEEREESNETFTDQELYNLFLSSPNQEQGEKQEHRD